MTQPIKKLFTPAQGAKIYDHLVQKQAREWAKLGTVNYSFYERQYNFTRAQIIEGLKELGVDYDAIPKQTKWYEFWVNDTDLKINYAISLL